MFTFLRVFISLNVCVVKKKLVLLLIVFITTFGCLPDGDQTIALSYIPSEFMGKWAILIRCQGADYDVMGVDFEIKDPKKFVAEGYGEDYDLVVDYFVFEAYYNPKTGELTAKIKQYDSTKKNLRRSDVLTLVWSDYDGGYILTENEERGDARDCNEEIRFYFYEDEDLN